MTFRHPFTLAGLDREWPPGTYVVDAEDEVLDVSFAAYRRVATRIRLTRGATTEFWPVSAHDLEAALQNDRGGVRSGQTKHVERDAQARATDARRLDRRSTGLPVVSASGA